MAADRRPGAAGGGRGGPAGDGLSADAAGLAAERTVLSWQRTALALVANGVLLLGRDPLGGGAGRVTAAGAFALAAVVALVARRRRRAPTAPVGARVVLGLGGAVAVLAVCAGLAVLD